MAIRQLKGYNKNSVLEKSGVLFLAILKRDEHAKKTLEGQILAGHFWFYRMRAVEFLP